MSTRTNTLKTPQPAVLAKNVEEYFGRLQQQVCEALERIDRNGRFSSDRWERPAGGGGMTRVLEQGAVFEKAGVNTSTVYGTLPSTLARTMNVTPAGFRATGISLVLHPQSPMVPTVHANLRFIQHDEGDAWFGGGIDLTPYYVYDEDVHHFHRTLRGACDRHDPSYYPRFKTWCDEYFFLRHRNEARGIGGIFFDYMRGDLEQIFEFVKSVGDAFLPAYVPIVERRMLEPYGEAERIWQLVRRGRYVEFNLVYDRGTVFGLETQGRTESILMSLPPSASWRYDYRPVPGSREARLVELLSRPQEWA